MRRAACRFRIPRRHLSLALLASATVSACAPVYLHSPSLEKSTASAAAALPPETDALKPFDDQLANLDAFAADENLAVARYWTSTRDAHFARLIAMPGLAARRAHVASLVNERLEVLTGGTDVRRLEDPEPQIAIKADLEDFADSQRRFYSDLKGADPKRELDCKAMRASMSEAEAEAAARSSDPLQVTLGNIARSCHRIARVQAKIDQLANVGGEIGAARKAAAEADAKTKTDLSDRAAALQKEIAAAETFAKTGAGVVQLREFEDRLKALLDDAALGTKAAGWKRAGDAIDEILKAEVCGSDSVDDATKKEADCGSVEPTSTTGRIMATWGLAKALAKIADANAATRRSVDWLLAAKAIIAAEQADSELSLKQGKAVATAERRRSQYLEREVLYLSRSRPGGMAGVAACRDAHCQLAAYLDAWNEGRVPAQVLEYRLVQIDREYAVRRARAVAQKQHALALAGATTLKDYGAGGLRAELIAQALFDIAMVGAGSF